MARATRNSAAKAFEEPVQLSSPPTTPVPRSARKRKAIKTEDSPEAQTKKSTTPKPAKRAKKSAVKTEDVDEPFQNLKAVPDVPPKVEKDDDTFPANKSAKTKRNRKSAVAKTEQVDSLIADAALNSDESPKKKAKAKNNGYGLTPGQSPYPNWPHPTAEECKEVVRLLSKVHGKVQAPKTIPTPSLEVAGCGEVPSVLDALIRTRLSAATSNTNSSRAFAGLVAKFGVLKEGIGKGSVDWNKVRQADTKDIFEAIKSGGLADVKSKDIKKILQMVWEENQARREELKSSSKKAPGSDHEPSEEKQAEIEKADQDIVSLDHLHLLSNDDAFNALTKYPGVGPKTASCVLLFCLQRPSFAVDTHVFRLCKWLGWVPPPGDPAGLGPGAKGTFAGPTRNSTYAHCEVRIPDDMKYQLHYLLIKHGKTCPRCRAITGEGSEGWDKGCVIDHLVKRSGGRKGEGDSPVKAVGSAKKKKAGKKTVVDEYESDAMSSGLSDAEVSEMSDLVSDAEIESSDGETSASD